MAGPLKFTINYTCSPNAISGILEYRHMQPNGAWSAWLTDIAAGTPFAINTNGGTVLNQTLSNIPGNGTDFMYNTTYDFRIKQTCDTGAIEYSNVSNPIYIAECPTIEFLSSDVYDPNGFSLIIRIYSNFGIGYPINPLPASIVSYAFDIQTNNGGLMESIGSFTVPVSSFTLGAPYYDLHITSDDLTIPIASLATYYLYTTFYLNDGTSVVLVNPCESPISVTTPPCSTYRIYYNEWFVIEYKDCNGIFHQCGALNVGGGSGGSWFYLCSQTQPKAYACKLTGAGTYTYYDTTSTGGGFTVGPNQLFYPGVTPFAYSPVTGNPMILYGALVELVTTNACDSDYNGYLNNVTAAQIGSPWFNQNTPIQCTTPACKIP